MLKVKLIQSVDGCTDFSYKNSSAKLLGSKVIIMDQNSEIKLLTELNNIKEINFYETK